jgi:hypothetical protein
MNLFYEQASMGSFFGYLMAGGCATTLEGDGNNSIGENLLARSPRWIPPPSFFQLQDAALERDGYCVSSVVCVQLREDIAHVSLNGLLRNA